MKKSVNNHRMIILIMCVIITGLIMVIIHQNSKLSSNYHQESAFREENRLRQGEAAQAEPEPPPPPPRYYLAFGDSVAAGFGVMAGEKYPELIFDMLSEADLANEYENFSANGFTTSMVIEQLNNLDEGERKKFKDAGVITLNIGGNNILKPLIAYLPDFQEIIDMITEAGSIASDAMLVASLVNELNNEVQQITENFSFADILRIGEFFQRTTDIFNDSVEVFGRMNELEANNPLMILSGPLPEELERELRSGVADFEREFGEIISWFNYTAPEAIVIVNTLYNPIPEELLGLQIEFHSQAEALTREVNGIIEAKQIDGGFLIADVYTAFASEADLSVYMNYHLDLSQLNLNFDIIHPNSEGHKLIAELNYSLIN